MRGGLGDEERRGQVGKTDGDTDIVVLLMSVVLCLFIFSGLYFSSSGVAVATNAGRGRRKTRTNLICILIVLCLAFGRFCVSGRDFEGVKILGGRDRDASDLRKIENAERK